MNIPGKPMTGRYVIIKAGDHENPVTIGEVKVFGTMPCLIEEGVDYRAGAEKVIKKKILTGKSTTRDGGGTTLSWSK